MHSLHTHRPHTLKTYMYVGSMCTSISPRIKKKGGGEVFTPGHIHY